MVWDVRAFWKRSKTMMRCLHRYRRHKGFVLWSVGSLFTVDARFGQCGNNDAFLCLWLGCPAAPLKSSEQQGLAFNNAFLFWKPGAASSITSDGVKRCFLSNLDSEFSGFEWSGCVSSFVVVLEQQMKNFFLIHSYPSFLENSLKILMKQSFLVVKIWKYSLL